MTIDSRLSVLHVITSLSVGGAEIHLKELLSGLIDSPYRVEVAFFKEVDNSPPMKADFEALGVTVHDLQGRGRVNWQALRRLIDLMKSGRFDLVHTHLFRADLYGAMAAVACPGMPVINSVHNPEDFYAKPWVARLGRLAARKQKATIAISQAVADHLKRHLRLGPDRVEVVYYGRTPDKRQGLDFRARWGIPQGAPLIGSVGRLAKQKGQIHLIRAMVQVIEKHAPARLVIVGRDDQGLGDDLMTEAERLGIGDRVILAGFHSEIPDVMAAFDVFCLPSLWEGFGLVLVEAMAEAKPVVAARAGSIPEVVEEGLTALLAEPGDENGLAQMLISILDNPDLAQEMGRAGQERQRRVFSRQAMVDSTVEFYDRILKG